MPFYPSYPGCNEVVPGVFISPGDAVYIRDKQGEIVSWNADEVAEDGEAFTAALHAVILATIQGPEAVRQNLRERGKQLEKLIADTAAKQTGAGGRLAT